MDVVCGDDTDAELAGQLHKALVTWRVAVDQVLLELNEDVVRAEPLQVVPQLHLGGGGSPLGDEAGHSPLSPNPPKEGVGLAS